MNKIIDLVNQFVKQLLCNKDGVTSIEYALLGSLIAVVIAVAVSAVGTNLIPIFNTVAAAF